MNKEQVIKSMHERMKRNIDDFFKPSTFEDTRKALLAKRAKWQEVWNVSKGRPLQQGEWLFNNIRTIGKKELVSAFGG